MIDELFIGRIYKSSIGWSALILSLMMIANLPEIAAGFAIGVAVGLGVLRTIEVIVRNVVVPGSKTAAKVKLGLFGVFKYLVLGIIISLIIRTGWISLPAFACGVGIPSAIIFLKTLGQFFREIGFDPFGRGAVSAESPE